MTLKSGKMSLKVIESGTGGLCTVFLLAFLVTLSLKRTIFEIFDFKNAVTMKTGLGIRQGHWKCHRAIERIRLPIDVL